MTSKRRPRITLSFNFGELKEIVGIVTCQNIDPFLKSKILRSFAILIEKIRKTGRLT